MANTGILTGDIHVHTEPIPRSAYVEQVKQIAPASLEDRVHELATLTQFCTQVDGPDYVWWRAPAWAGKSALMAWFTLNPPPGIRIVPFFVTARFAGHSDRTAFAEIVLEQLLDFLDRPLPALVTSATRESHLLRALKDAAEACQEAGERLILLVDGLDEDRGVTARTDAHSIAALLPGRLEGGMRVIVASREHPQVPDDVPTDHPLRSPAITASLRPSEYAEVARHDLTRDVRRLLRGNRLEVQIVGLVATAGGGLTTSDLASLARTEVWQIEGILYSVAGRSFSFRQSHWGVRNPVYVMGHEELQASVISHLGTTQLAKYRSRLHKWADSFRDDGWPSDTPEYLLRGYFRMLRDSNDLQRMTACATDEARHERLSAMSGGDAAAVAEIEATQTALLHQHNVDLHAMARIAIHRALLRERNTRLPVQLPALWAALGDASKAEALAMSIDSPEKRAQALIAVIKELARTGTLHEMKRFAGLADDAIRGVREDTSSRDWLFSEFAAISAQFDSRLSQVYLGQISDLDLRRKGAAARAVEQCRLAPAPENVTVAEQRCHELRQVIDAAVLLVRLIDLVSKTATGSIAGERILDAAEQLVLRSSDKYGRPRALSELAAAAASRGDLARAGELAENAAHLANEIPHQPSRTAALRKIAEDAAAAGLRSHATRFLIAAAPAPAGTDSQPTGNGSEASAVDLASWPVEAIEDLISRAAVCQRLGDTDQALRLAGQCETLARQRNPSAPQWHTDVAYALAVAGQTDLANQHIDHAEQMCETLDFSSAVRTQSHLVLAISANGDASRALLLADQIEERLSKLDDRRLLASHLDDLADALETIGKTERARALTGRARKIAPGLQRVVLRKADEAHKLILRAGRLQLPEQQAEAATIFDYVESIAQDIDQDSASLIHSWLGRAAAQIGTTQETQRSNRHTATSLALGVWTTPLCALGQHHPALLVEIVEHAQALGLLQSTT